MGDRIEGRRHIKSDDSKPPYFRVIKSFKQKKIKDLDNILLRLLKNVC